MIPVAKLSPNPFKPRKEFSSEELDELLEICDALHVIAGGRLSQRIPVAEATVELIGERMS